MDNASLGNAIKGKMPKKPLQKIAIIFVFIILGSITVFGTTLVTDTEMNTTGELKSAATYPCLAV